MIKFKKGSGSPYWDWVMKHQRQDNNHGEGGVEVWEPIEANPDHQCSESLYEQRDGESFKEFILNNSLVKKIEELCTRREKDVIKLLQKGYNQSEVAKKLRLPIGAINTLVARVREKAMNLVYRKPKYGGITRTRKLV